MRLVIDPGHGGPDPGATANGIVEADMTSYFALALAGAIRMNRPDVAWTMTRGAIPEKKVNLAARGNHSREQSADLVISLHCNAGDPQANGLLAFYWPDNIVGLRVAKAITAKVPRALERPFNHRGPFPALEASWPRVRNVLKVHACTAVLVELGFLTNLGDARALQDADVQVGLVHALLAGVEAFGGE